MIRLLGHKSNIVTALLLLYIGGVAIHSFAIVEPVSDKTDIGFYVNRTVTFTGIVARPPDQRITHHKLTIQAWLLETEPVTGLVLISTALYPPYQYGDLVKVTCLLVKPQPFEDFAYDRYLARYGIYAQCQRARLTVIQRNRGNAVLHFLDQLRQQIIEVINFNLHEPQASITRAMLLADDGAIPQDVRDSFSRAGVSHILAISGLNMTLLISITGAGLIFLGLYQRQAFWVTTVLLVSYSIIIGFPASAVRAVIMGWTLLLARQVGRRNSSNSVLLAAVLMLAVNPRLLRDDIGFQLSFAAVLGLGWFQLLFQKLLRPIPNIFELRSVLAMTLAAQLTTFPLIAIHFGQLGLLGPAANILIIPTLPYMMISAIVAIAVNLVCPVAALFWPVHVLVEYQVVVAKFLGAYGIVQF